MGILVSLHGITNRFLIFFFFYMPVSSHALPTLGLFYHVFCMYVRVWVYTVTHSVTHFQAYNVAV